MNDFLQKLILGLAGNTPGGREQIMQMRDQHARNADLMQSQLFQQKLEQARQDAETAHEHERTQATEAGQDKRLQATFEQDRSREERSHQREQDIASRTSDAKLREMVFNRTARMGKEGETSPFQLSSHEYVIPLSAEELNQQKTKNEISQKQEILDTILEQPGLKDLKPDEKSQMIRKYWGVPDSEKISESEQMGKWMRDKDWKAINQFHASQALSKKEAAGGGFDPETIDYWSHQVLRDSKNLALVPPAAKGAVGKRLSELGKNVNQLDAQTRDSANFAKTLQPHLTKIQAEIADLDKEGRLGPIAGRFNEFMTGKYGDGSPKVAQFRTDMQLFKTALGRIHGGARGGASPYMIEHMNNIMGQDKMNAETLKSAVGAANEWVNGYANLIPESEGVAAQGATSPMGAATGSPLTAPGQNGGGTLPGGGQSGPVFDWNSGQVTH